MKNVLFVLLFVVLSSGSCEKEHETEVIRSFCYWKTDLSFDKEDDSIIKDMKVRHLYVRFFDVDWNPFSKEPLPVATIRDIRLNESNPEITPSVFITNEVVLKSDKKQLDSLAIQITKRIQQIGNKMNEIKAESIAYKIVYPQNYNNKKDFKQLNYDSVKSVELAKLKVDFKEILLDCDWSEKSKENYFYLLQKIKKKFQLQILLLQFDYGNINMLKNPEFLQLIKAC
jgi:hypothetical protein